MLEIYISCHHTNLSLVTFTFHLAFCDESTFSFLFLADIFHHSQICRHFNYQYCFNLHGTNSKDTMKKQLHGKDLVLQVWDAMQDQQEKNSADKRDRDRVFAKMESEVEKGHNKCDVISFAMACRVDPDRSVKKVEMALPNIPNSPLEAFFKDNGQMIKGLEAAMRQTQHQLNMLRVFKGKGDMEAFARTLKIDLDEVEMEEEEEVSEDSSLHLTEEEHSDLTPQVPILQMTLDQVSSYYAQLMKKLLEMEAGGGKPGRLWAGKEGKPPAGERQ